MTSSVTKDAAVDLGLAVGQPATVFIKSTEVTIGVEYHGGDHARRTLLRGHQNYCGGRCSDPASRDPARSLSKSLLRDMPLGSESDQRHISGAVAGRDSGPRSLGHHRRPRPRSDRPDEGDRVVVAAGRPCQICPNCRRGSTEKPHSSKRLNRQFPHGRLVGVGMSAEAPTIGPTAMFGLTRKQVLGHLGYQNVDIATLAKLVSLGRLDVSRSISEIVSLKTSRRASTSWSVRTATRSGSWSSLKEPLDVRREACPQIVFPQPEHLAGRFDAAQPAALVATR